MAAVFAFGKRGANNSAPVSNYLISKGFDFDGVKVGYECKVKKKGAVVYQRPTRTDRLRVQFQTIWKSCSSNMRLRV